MYKLEYLVLLGMFLGIRNPDPHMLGNHTVTSSARGQLLVSQPLDGNHGSRLV
jgi:hypothetical protein